MEHALQRPLHLSRRPKAWLVYATSIGIGTYLFYGKGWRDNWNIPTSTAWRLRLTAFIVILVVSALAILAANLLPAGKHVRAITAGLITGLLLHYLAGWVGDHYLGGQAHPDPHSLAGSCRKGTA